MTLFDLEAERTWFFEGRRTTARCDPSWALHLELGERAFAALFRPW